MDELFSLWLIPPKELTKKYTDIIIKLGNKHNAPVFSPHITLLGNIKNKKTILLKTSQMVQIIKPFTIKLTNVSYLNEYYKCVFLLAKKSKELINTNDIAKRIFYRENEEFIPHLSLMYGKYDEKTKKEIAAKLGTFNDSFTIDKIAVVTAGDIPKDWNIVKEFPLLG